MACQNREMREAPAFSCISGIFLGAGELTLEEAYLTPVEEADRVEAWATVRYGDGKSGSVLSLPDPMES